MKKRRTFRGALMLLVALALSACAASKDPATTLDPKPRAERPTYVLGEKWMRSDGVYTLVRIEPDSYIFSAGPGQEIHLTKDLMVARLQRGQSFWEFDPPPRLTWPLAVGKWGASRALLRTSSHPEDESAELTWSVDGYQDIHVLSAGTFKVFRISLSVKPERVYLQSSGVAHLWYAPEVRQFVKMEGTGMTSFLNFELVAARPSVTARPFRLTDRVQQAFEEYRSNPRFYHFKAFSFDEMSGASGRAWGYYTPKRAIDRAMRECSHQSRGCKVYAVGNTIVWDKPPEEISAIAEEYFARTAEVAGFPRSIVRLDPIPEVGQKGPAGTRLSSDEIRTYYHGNRFEGISVGGIRFTVEYSADGTMFGQADFMSDRGTWSLRNDKLCRQWQTWFDGHMDCQVILRDGEALRIYDSNGQATSKIVVPDRGKPPGN